MHSIFDLVIDIFVGGRSPRMDLVVATFGIAIGGLTGALMYAEMLRNGSMGLLAWLLIPMTATFIVATVLGRPNGVRGAFLATTVAVLVGLPMALLDVMFGF